MERADQRVREKTKGSFERFQRASRTLAGGVSSVVRRSMRPYPLYFSQGSGSRVIDVDGNSYVDYGLAWRPLILGHTPREVVESVASQLSRGLTFGAQHDLEFEVSERLTRIIPCAESVCFASSGTEIVQVALWLARAFTGRLKYVKFEGNYHGWDDSVLVSYHPDIESLNRASGTPVAEGEGQRPHSEVFVVEWNDRNGVERVFAEHTAEVSAVICELLLCNSGCIPPEPGYLELLRDFTKRNGSLLIFDVSFSKERPRNYRETVASRKSLYADFTLCLLDEGILTLPDGRWYLSAAHSNEDIETTLAAVECVTN